MRSLTDFAAKMNVDISQLGVRLEVPEELDRGIGVRQRLDDNRAVAYWPRMIITNADSHESDSPQPTADESPQPEGDRSKQPMKIAERLRFVHVGQRARAETILQQRQPGLVESLIAQQIRVHSYQPGFAGRCFN